MRLGVRPEPPGLLAALDEARDLGLDARRVGDEAIANLIVAQRLGPALDRHPALVGALGIAERLPVQVEEGGEPDDRVGLGAGDCIDQCVALAAVVGQGGDHVVLGLEVEVEGPLADAGFPRDVADRGGVEAVQRKSALRRRENLLPATFLLSVGEPCHSLTLTN